jgi:hypothetical protein
VEYSVEITLPADNEGYVPFECPHCSDRFKLSAAEYEGFEGDDIWCPLCGLNSAKSDFLTQEFLEAARQHVENFAREALHKMSKNIERKTRHNKGVRFEAGPAPKRRAVPGLPQEVADMAIVNLKCCDMSVKTAVPGGLAVLYCPYCGTEGV